MKIPVARFDLDMLRALQYAYYCKNISILPDDVFDRMEREYFIIYGEKLPLGSDKPNTYTNAHRSLALYFIFTYADKQQGRQLL